MTSQKLAPTRNTQAAIQKVAVRPRQLVHRGVVQARGLWFDLDVLGEAAARHRVLDSWENGATVGRFPDGFLLLWPNSRRIVCERASALPLVESAGVLLSAPLSREERQQLLGEDKRTALSTLVLVRASQAEARAVSDAQSEDIARWLDVSNFRLETVQSLGEAPAAPLVLVEKPTFDARQTLTGQKADPQLQRVLDALRGETLDPKAVLADGKIAAKRGFSWPSLPPLRGVAASVWNTIDGVRPWQKVREGESRPVPLLVSWALIAFFNWLLQGNIWTFLFASFVFWALREILPAVQVPQNATLVTAGPPKSAAPRPAKKPSSGRLMSALSRAIMMSRLANLVGRRHARYIAQMMEMFERGDWDNALRHAIPMGKEGDAADNPFLGRLMARKDLNISAQSAGASSAIGFGEELSTRLRALYRRAFENLKERGRIEEAAFVLAELLESNEEAVAFLESHDRKVLAAEMAEARSLAPGLIVRQWFVAGDEERAVAVARRHNAFADAVLRLEQKNDERTQWLRVLWARTLGQSGQYAAAVEALWPIESLREASRAYAELALESGGESAARVLARLLQVDENALQDETMRHRVLDLLHSEDEENARARLAFAQVLHGYKVAPIRNNATQNAARLSARALLRDAASGFSVVEPKAFNTLLDLSRDNALRADVPALPQNTKRETLSTRTAPLDISIAANDTGTTPITDAAFLPDGKCVVALGEAGAQLINREGRVVHRFDQPCHKLVLSDNGDRAIALAPRGQIQSGVDANGQAEIGTVYRLAHLDFARRSAKHWCEAVVGAHAESYDGSVWYASVGRELCAIDVLNPQFAALWKSGDTGGQISTVARSETELSLLTVSQNFSGAWEQSLNEPIERWEQWTFQLMPSPVLRHRTAPTVLQGDNAVKRGVHASNQSPLVILQSKSENLAPDQAPPFLLTSGAEMTELTPPSSAIAPALTEGIPSIPIRHKAWFAVCVQYESGAVCYSIGASKLQIRARFFLEGATNISLRFAPNQLVVTDNLGRLLVLDLESGQLVRDLRL